MAAARNGVLGFIITREDDDEGGFISRSWSLVSPARIFAFNKLVDPPPLALKEDDDDEEEVLKGDGWEA